MNAIVVLHPKAIERFGLLPIVVGLKNRGWDVSPFGKRFYTAKPEPVVEKWWKR